MRAPSTLFRFLARFLFSLPKRLQQTIFRLFETIWDGAPLTLTGIARHLRGRAKMKHKIKLVDRLLSNPTLHHAFPALFAAIARTLLAPNSRPVLLIDWTCFDKTHYALVASISHEGRALPIYVEVHPQKDNGTEAVESAFLTTLNEKILPKGCIPVVVTDAGFRNPWFAQVRRLGWDFVGRLCGTVLVQPVEATADIWLRREVVMAQASTRPKDVGEYRVARSNPLTARLVTVHTTSARQPSQTRTPSRKQEGTAARYRRLAEEPWLLATSLDLAAFPAAVVVALYARRMQIEESFKDDKNRDSGLGLDASRSRTPTHLRALRWMGALTSLLTHTLGIVGEQLGLHREYQSNTVSDRRVLSLPFLGRQILYHEDRRRITLKRLNDALARIQTQADIAYLRRHPNIAPLAA